MLHTFYYLSYIGKDVKLKVSDLSEGFTTRRHATSQLKAFHLFGSDWLASADYLIQSVLERCPNLEELYMGTIIKTNTLLGSFHRLLKCVPQLHTLHLQNVQAHSINDGEYVPNNLQTLILENCYLRLKTMNLTGVTTLTKLHLVDVPEDDEKLQELIQTNPGLSDIKLSKMSISFAGILKIFKYCRSLQQLHLQKSGDTWVHNTNVLRPDVINWAAVKLQTQKKLTKLTVGQCSWAATNLNNGFPIILKVYCLFHNKTFFSVLIFKLLALSCYSIINN